MTKQTDISALFEEPKASVLEQLRHAAREKGLSLMIVSMHMPSVTR